MNKISHRFALLFLALTLAELAFLSFLLPLDAAVFDWLQAHRSCALNHLAPLQSDWPIVSLIVLWVFALGWLWRKRYWTEAWRVAFVVIGGGLFIEVLKTGFERARPSVLPPLFTGNSFPSGHIGGVVLFAGVLCYLLARQQWKRTVKQGGVFLLASLVGITIWQRLYSGHHWMSDVIGSVLLMSAWLCFTLPYPELFSSVKRSAVVVVGMMVCYASFYCFPSTRLILPSVRSEDREPLRSVVFGEPPIQPLLQGMWGDHTEEPAGPITWMGHGVASVAVNLPESQPYTLRLAVRLADPPNPSVCTPLEILVNQHPAGRLLLSRGWREYGVHLNPSSIVPGLNLITFRTSADTSTSASDQRTVAFRYLHLFPEK
jgi:undecaprenyl-diphosphatase